MSLQFFTRLFRLNDAWGTHTFTANPLLLREFAQFAKVKEFSFRPYLHRHWSAQQRMDVIANHYRLISECVPLLNLATDECMELGKFDTEAGALRVIIDRPRWLRREGEIALSLFLGIDRIYTTVFVLTGTASDMKLMVGNIQGDNRERTADYKKLTKAMHGMRPRDLLLHMLKIFSELVGCKNILGISDDAHRSRHWMTRAKKAAKYDPMWLEHGGLLLADGFFHLPAQYRKRNDCDIPSNKRSLYRRRYEALDQLAQAFKSCLADPPAKCHFLDMHNLYLREPMTTDSASEFQKSTGFSNLADQPAAK